MKSAMLLSLISLLSFASSEVLMTFKTNKAQSSIKIDGTSTLHDWEMMAEDLSGTMDVEILTDSINIKDLSLIVPVKSLKSGNSGMDNNAYKTLKAENHPLIKYRFTSLKKMEKTGTNTFKLLTNGKLTVGGKTQILAIPLTATLKNKGIELSGTTSFPMSNFNLQPPTFMFGTVTTGDDITIQFNINFN